MKVKQTLATQKKKNGFFWSYKNYSKTHDLTVGVDHIVNNLWGGACKTLRFRLFSPCWWKSAMPGHVLVGPDRFVCVTLEVVAVDGFSEKQKVLIVSWMIETSKNHPVLLLEGPKTANASELQKTPKTISNRYFFHFTSVTIYQFYSSKNIPLKLWPCHHGSPSRQSDDAKVDWQYPHHAHPTVGTSATWGYGKCRDSILFHWFTTSGI